MPDYDAEADAIDSYNDAVRVVGEKVKAGAAVPEFFLPATQRKRRGGLPAAPLNIKAEQAKADAIIAYAAQMKDWPLLEQAIDAKLEQQREFAGWWGEEVSVLHGGVRSKNAERGSWSLADAERLTGIKQQQVSRWKKQLQDSSKYRAQQLLAAYRKAGLEPLANHRAEGTGEFEWYTPARYIEATREVMGAIDLDPASHPNAQATVQAARFFTAEDDGLKQQWHGRVWLNPPYAQPTIARFVEKLVEEVSAGRVEQAIMLTHNYTDTGWFHHGEAAADLLCFTRGRIAFIDADGDPCAPPTQGQAFFYYGPNIELFRDVFSQFGFVR